MKIEKIKVEIHLYQRVNISIGKIAICVGYRMHEIFQNSLNFGILIFFQISKILILDF